MNKYKNYIILFFIFVITIIGCIYALEWHDVYKENERNTTIITDYIQELNKEEFMNYISDNPYAIIYYGVTANENCRRFEREFKDFIIDRDLRQTIVYMNVNELVGGDFSQKLDALFNTNDLRDQGKNFKYVPAIAIYNHTTLVNFVSDENLRVIDVEELLDQYNISGE